MVNAITITVRGSCLCVWLVVIHTHSTQQNQMIFIHHADRLAACKAKYIDIKEQ